MSKNIGPQNLGGVFSLIAKSMGGWWISGIILSAIFAAVFRIWAGSNLIPLLFLFCILIRIPAQYYPVHRMFEVVTLSSIIIAQNYNPLMAGIFAVSAFAVSRFFGPVEDPTITIELGIVTVIMAYFVPILAPNFAFLMLVAYLSALRVVLFTLMNLIIVRSVSLFAIHLFWALVVGVGFNYGLALFLIKLGWLSG